MGFLYGSGKSCYKEIAVVKNVLSKKKIADVFFAQKNVEFVDKKILLC